MYRDSRENQLFIVKHGSIGNTGELKIYILDFIYEHSIGDMKALADLWIKRAENREQIASKMVECVSAQGEKEKKRLEEMNAENKTVRWRKYKKYMITDQERLVKKFDRMVQVLQPYCQ